MLARIEHVALWVEDLELMRAFYTERLGGSSGELYENPSAGFRSYFVSFGDGARLELMSMPDLSPGSAKRTAGFAHIALTLSAAQAVDAAVADLRGAGVPIASEPRTTGDGYYEAVILDPEGNHIELTA